MALLRRECRQLSLPPIKFRRPIDILLEDVRQSKRPFIYHGRDILKENIRATRSLRPPRPPQRQVPPFSVQLKQKNVVAAQPAAVTKRSKSAESLSEDAVKFGVAFRRGDFPVLLEHSGGPGEPPRALRWTRPLRQLYPEEISQLLSRFSQGLSIQQQPLRNVAEWGVNDLLDVASGAEPVLESLPTLVRGVRSMLISVDKEKKRSGLRLLSKLSKICGPSLVPFYRQLLPPLRRVGQSWRGGSTTDMETEATLNELERSGGPTAFVNIKYVLPAYESCLPRF